ncbi:MAG: DUF1540 domain-containing protein [Clostridia bacterium]|nr:DUF1540 domain-containing protein [Clostridia bacterium]
MDCKKDKKICCKVENCVYHSEHDRCTASHIDVGPQFACCSQDTVCATFKPEKDIR